MLPFSHGGIPSLDINRELCVRGTLSYGVGLVVAQLRMSLPEGRREGSCLIEDKPGSCLFGDESSDDSYPIWR